MKCQNQMFNQYTLNVFSNIVTSGDSIYIESRIYSGIFSLAKTVLDDCQIEITPRTEVDALILENSFNVIFLRLKNRDKNIRFVNTFCQSSGILRRLVDIAYTYKHEEFNIDKVIEQTIDGVSRITSTRLITTMIDLLSGVYGDFRLGFYIVESDPVTDIKLYFADLDSSSQNKFREVKNLRYDTKMHIKGKMHSITEEE